MSLKRLSKKRNREDLVKNAERARRYKADVARMRRDREQWRLEAVGTGMTYGDWKRRQVVKAEDGEEEDRIFTKELLKATLPQRMASALTEDMVKDLNSAVSGGVENAGLRDAFRDNFLSNTGLLATFEKGYTLRSYKQAVMFATLRLLGESKVGAWRQAYPERLAKVIEESAGDRKRERSRMGMGASYAERNPLVTELMKRAMIPMWLLNQDVYQKAINVQAELMLYAKSEKVRSDAANSLMTHLKVPETAKVEMDVKVTEDESIRELRAATLELAKQQREAIKQGSMTAGNIAEYRIVEGERLDG